MLGSASYVFAYFAFVFFLAGALVGVVLGAAAAAVLKNGWSGLPWDAALGGAALIGTLIFFAVLPWPRNTVSIYSHGEVIGSSTMDRYQNPEPIAWTLTALLPVAHEANRYRRRRRKVCKI